ncbi:PEP-CTERM sorting domain-containing protein [Sulfuriroseicoccus oceanibius]|uniref:PEP-CTERM sorting domain-containing protein n=1 Tax=Sulfuriroseicoccus oceanibius TaxID=2707525 RepID=A0A6B3L3D0_9BACT|nr:PEP-CTERM sorting domain-containing protein [Sulfuriroseicoccus oceanibius]QQL45585.1 PEP-CTERM sorting domain-containing protein [Sulfuriroseicoccus oceanibius]
MIKISITSLIAGAAMIGVASAATSLTNQLLVNFDGSLAGSTYTLGGGEIDTTGTFSASGGVGVVPGSAFVAGGTDGFTLDPTSIGTLTSTSWVAETVVSFNTFGGGQLTAISVQGDTDFRINNNGGELQVGYWDGGTYGSVAGDLPDVGVPVHLAMVWDATNSSLTGYVNGVMLGTVDNNDFAVPDSSYVSYGFFDRSGFEGRGIDAEMYGAAFSTFTGTFDEGADFQLSLATNVPEPTSTTLLGLGGLALILRRRP